jgi:hypothetical protein
MPDTATLEIVGAATASLAPTVTLHDVELVTTGVHPGATGATPVAREDLESMIAASGDPEIDRAPAHPGHFDPRFVQALADGEPALGYVVPRRIVDLPGGAAKLIGDLVDVPAKMAAIIPKAFARRSVEFSPRVTPSGRAYRAALDGLALLGVAIPAVKGLADIANRYSAGPPVVPSTSVFLSDTPTVEASLHGAWWSTGHDDPHAVPVLPTEGGALMPRFDTARYQALLTQESARHAQAMAGLLSQAQVADQQVAPPLPGFPGLPAPAAPAAPQMIDPATGYPVAAAPAAPQLPPAVPVAPAPPAAPAPAAPAGYAFDPVTQQYVPAAPVPAVQPAPVPAPAPAAAYPGYPAYPAPAPQPAPLGFAPPAPAVPAAPAPVAPAPGYPAGFTAPAPAAPAAPTPGAVPPLAPSPLVAQLSAGQLSELQARAARGEQAMMALEAQQREHYLSAAVNEGRISVAERQAWAAQMAQPGQMAPTVAAAVRADPGPRAGRPARPGRACRRQRHAPAASPTPRGTRGKPRRSARPRPPHLPRPPRRVLPRRRPDRSLTHAGTRRSVPEQLDPVLGRRRRDHLPRRRWAHPRLPVRRDRGQPGERAGQPGHRALPGERRCVRRQRAGPRRDRRDRARRRHRVALQVQGRRGARCRRACRRRPGRVRRDRPSSPVRRRRSWRGVARHRGVRRRDRRPGRDRPLGRRRPRARLTDLTFSRPFWRTT